MINFVTYNGKVYATSQSIWEFLIFWVAEIFYCSSFHTNTRIWRAVRTENYSHCCITIAGFD